MTLALLLAGLAAAPLRALELARVPSFEPVLAGPAMEAAPALGLGLGPMAGPMPPPLLLSAPGGLVLPPQAVPSSYVGILSRRFDHVAASQRTPVWCWAAGIEMVLRYYGLMVPQEDIVARTYGTDWRGRPLETPASLEAITSNLNHAGVDRVGRRYAVRAKMMTDPTTDDVLRDLAQGKPLILAVVSGSGSGHIVVVTAASVSWMPEGPRLRTLVARDPFATPLTIPTRGRAEYSLDAPPGQGGLPGRVTAVWSIDVTVE